MGLNVYTIDDCLKWDSIVKSFKSYDIYYLSGYTKAFHVHGDGQPILLYYEDENIRGMNVVMKRDISRDKRFESLIPPNTYFDLITPYGYGGWIIEGEDSAERLFKEYEEWAKANCIISEFVRFHPVIENAAYSKKNYDVIPLGNTICMDISSEEGIWANITSKNRNMIRKAQKNGIRIFKGKSKEIFEEFRKIYNGTMDKDNADAYYYFGEAFYDSIREDLAENAEIFYAQMEDGTVIAASIILWGNNHLNYHLSGSLREFQNLAPTNLLLYEAAVWGSKNGFNTFHLGGGVGSGEDNLYKFKKSFYRGEPCKFHIGKKIFDEASYNKLLAMRDDPGESSFFPKYRA